MRLIGERPILDTRKDKELEGIDIAKKQVKYKGKQKKYHAGATGKDKVVYDRVIELLDEGKSVMDISKEVDLARNTVYAIKRDWVYMKKDTEHCNAPQTY